MTKPNDSPWSVQDSRDGGESLSIIARDALGEYRLASVHGAGEHSIAIARLIAAAPALMFSLRELLNFIENDGKCGDLQKKRQLLKSCHDLLSNLQPESRSEKCATRTLF